jgi:hypothetical protein
MLVRIGFLAASLAFFVAGVLAAFLSREAYQKFLEAWLHASSWSESGPPSKGSLAIEVSRRLAGIGIAIIGGIMVAGGIGWFLGHRATGPVTQQPLPVTGHASGPLALVLAIVLISGGMFAAINPGPLVRFSAAHLALGRHVHERLIRRWAFLYRLYGGVAIVAGCSALRVWLSGR